MECLQDRIVVLGSLFGLKQGSGGGDPALGAIRLLQSCSRQDLRPHGWVSPSVGLPT